LEQIIEQIGCYPLDSIQMKVGPLVENCCSCTRTSDRTQPVDGGIGFCYPSASYSINFIEQLFDSVLDNAQKPTLSTTTES
jgi:hypothetical protein